MKCRKEKWTNPVATQSRTFRGRVLTRSIRTCIHPRKRRVSETNKENPRINTSHLTLKKCSISSSKPSSKPVLLSILVSHVSEKSTSDLYLSITLRRVRSISRSPVLTVDLRLRCMQKSQMQIMSSFSQTSDKKSSTKP